MRVVVAVLAMLVGAECFAAPAATSLGAWQSVTTVTGGVAEEYGSISVGEGAVVAVYIVHRHASTAGQVSSCTLNDEEMNLRAVRSGLWGGALYTKTVAAGTYDLAATFSQDVTNSYVYVLLITGANSEVPQLTLSPMGSGIAASGTVVGDGPSVAAYAFGFNGGSLSGPTWTGPSGLGGGGGSSVRSSHASQEFDGSSTSWQVTGSGSSGSYILIAGVWSEGTEDEEEPGGGGGSAEQTFVLQVISIAVVWSAAVQSFMWFLYVKNQRDFW